MKDKGYRDILGPRPVIEQSFRDGYIADGKGWAQMHQSRNLTSHTYDEDTAVEIVTEIKEIYFGLLKSLLERLEKEQKEQNSLFDE